MASMETGGNKDWRYWVGTLLMAAAVVFLVTANVNPPPDTMSGPYTVGYYTTGLLMLGLGYWLRRSSSPE